MPGEREREISRAKILRMHQGIPANKLKWTTILSLSRLCFAPAVHRAGELMSRVIKITRENGYDFRKLCRFPFSLLQVIYVYFAIQKRTLDVGIQLFLISVRFIRRRYDGKVRGRVETIYNEQ